MTDRMDLCDKMLAFSFLFSEHMIKCFKQSVNINNRIYKNLSIRKFRILYLLSAKEKCTVSEIADSFFISKSSLSITISRMVEEGLIKKEYPQKGQDGRMVYIVITDIGEEILKAVYKDIRGVIDSYFNSLSADDLKNLEKGLDLLGVISFKSY